jgi:hypothetical protein
MTTVRTYLAQLGGIEANGASGGPAETSLQTGLPLNQIACNQSFGTGAATITFAAALPSWVVASMNVYDVTNSQQIGTVSSVSANGLTLTLSANMSHASSGAADVLQFGLTPSDLAQGYATARDLSGEIQVAYLKAAELAQLIADIEKVVTSGQDSAANTILAAAAAVL